MPLKVFQPVFLKLFKLLFNCPNGFRIATRSQSNFVAISRLACCSFKFASLEKIFHCYIYLLPDRCPLELRDDESRRPVSGESLKKLIITFFCLSFFHSLSLSLYTFTRARESKRGNNVSERECDQIGRFIGLWATF